MNFDRRSEAREQVNLPVSLGGGEAGFTRDVSASGLFFVVDGTPEVGSTIAFTVSLPDNDRPLRLQACGRVVRVEPQGERSGVGVRIVSSTLATVPHDGYMEFNH